METNHISVCICTFKRPDLLNRLLHELEYQKTEGLFTYSVVVIDNDYRESAKQIVLEYAEKSSITINYCLEPKQNIARARNKALENAKGNFIAFIDDDEIPARNWLYNLFKTCNAYRAHGVLGPVIPYFEKKPSHWIIKGRFFERLTYNSGYKLKWYETRTGNCLFRKEILDGENHAFRPEFATGSEDVDFFRRMMKKGKIFIWCNEAIVYEFIPSSRCKASYLLKLALLRGGNSLKYGNNLTFLLFKSFIAIPLYSFLLPFFWIIGFHYLMIYLIKIFDHVGRLFALIGIYPIKKRDF